RDLEAAGRGLSWRDRGSGAHRSVFQSDPAAWEADPVPARAARDGDGASLVDTAGPGRGVSGAGNEAFRGRPEGGRQGHPRLSLTGSIMRGSPPIRPRNWNAGLGLSGAFTFRNASVA